LSSVTKIYNTKIPGADTAQNLMGRGPRKIGWVGVGGGAPAAGGSVPQANFF